MPLRRPRGVLGQHRPHRPERLAAPAVGGGFGQFHIGRGTRRQPRHRQRARLHRQAVHLVRPLQREPGQIGEVVPIDQAYGAVGAVALEADRLDDLLVLDQTRGRRPVGEDQPVADEVAVVQFLAEVAAVGVAQLGVADAVVDPLPDEAALEPLVPFEQLLVVGESARTVAHGVGVLALDEGEFAPFAGAAVQAPPDPLDLVVEGVHPRVHIRVPAVPVALVVHQAVGVAATDPLRHRGQAAPGAGLVAQRPEDHRRMVLVPLDHPGRAVQQGRGPAVVVDGVVAPVLLGEAVGLQIALVDDPQAQLVAEIQEGGVRRVVGGADRVEVVPLHQQHVLAHGRQVQRAAVLRVPLVPVDALEEERRAVDLDQAVFEHDRAEADPERDPLALGGQHPVVQPGRLGGPRLHRHRRRLPGREVETQLRHGHPALGRRVHPQRARAPDMVVGGVHEEVADGARRAVQQGDVAEDAGQPPLVLVLQVRARGPLVDPDGQHIAARLQQVPDRELVRQPGALELAQLGAVQPDPGAGLHAVEADRRVPVRGPVLGEVEAAQVVAGGVVRRDVRRVHREGVEVVGVDGGTVPLEDPVAGNRHRCPVRGVVPLGGEGVVLGVRRRRQPEAPTAVE